MRKVPLPIRNAMGTSSGSERIKTTSAVSIATSVPAPMAIPMSAVANAGASLTPSPTMATFLPALCSSATLAALSPGSTSAITVLSPGQENGASLGATKTNYNDDIIMGWVGIGSQLDGLGHIGTANVYYNCNKAGDFVTAGGLKKLGIENVPAIATRGVILDMVGLTGKDPVPEGTAFNKKEIDAAVARQGIKPPGKGDVVIFYTGWTKLIGKDDKRYGSVEPGLGVEGARYLASLNVAAVGADTWGLEVIPFEVASNVFHVHQILLTENGMHILENVNAEEAVKDKVYEGLFTLGPSRITGAVQAIINPIFVY